MQPPCCIFELIKLNSEQIPLLSLASQFQTEKKQMINKIYFSFSFTNIKVNDKHIDYHLLLNE